MLSSGMGRSKNWNQGWDGVVIVRKEKGLHWKKATRMLLLLLLFHKLNWVVGNTDFLSYLVQKGLAKDESQTTGKT